MRRLVPARHPLAFCTNSISESTSTLYPHSHPRQFHTRPKGDDGRAQLTQLLAAGRAAGDPLGVIAKENPEGAFCVLWDEMVKASGAPTVDVSAALAQARLVAMAHVKVLGRYRISRGSSLPLRRWRA